MPITGSIGLAALGWVVSPVIKDLVNKCTSYLGSNTARDLDDLATSLLPELHLTIQAAQNSPHEATLADWLARLKGAYYDAEGILHKLEYKRLKQKVKSEDNKFWVRISSYPIFKPLAKFIGKVNRKVFLLSKLRRRLNKLKEIAADAKKFRELLGIQTGNPNGITACNNPPVTSSFLPHKVFGRDQDCNRIINFLLDEQGGTSSTIRSYSVVAITGIGGGGKTTLAQYVYNNKRVKNHFGANMWLCLSRNLDVVECTKEMIESASKGGHPNLCNIHNFDTLQNKLMEILQESEKILLVLDDVWYNKQAGDEQWDSLLAPLASIRERCKILVTSRSKKFPAVLQPGLHIKLQDLAHNDFLSLFRYYAFLGSENIDILLKNRLTNIGDRIAKKISKSPLTAKVVGNQLSEQPNIGFWQATLRNVNLSSTRKVLLWSYQCLDVQIQRCFLFCSIFPKGRRHSIVHLRRYWVALDFIQASDDNKSVEDICFEYFHMMVANSIFQLVDGWYIMHDLFHDLAEKLSTEDCLRAINSEREIPSTLLHVFLSCNNENLKENISNIYNLSNLRTLILKIRLNIEDVNEIFSMISTNFKNLRALSLQLRGYKTLPRVVGDMRNLRYLNVRRSSIKELPDSVSQLYHLQFLLLPSSVKILPTKLSNLIKLRRLDIYHSNGTRVHTLPPVPFLGKLTSLQLLDEFHVRKEEGYELRQLGSLREIGCTLRIMNLENVRHKNDAIEAKLIHKSKLEGLELMWGGSADSGSELEVIEALEPPPDLEVLAIDGYRGSEYPTWLIEGSFIENMKEFKLCNCNSLTILPLNFHQYRHCLGLDLKNLEALREVPALPESLSWLKIMSCPCLIFVCENEQRLNENQGIIEQEFWISRVMSFLKISVSFTYYMKAHLPRELNNLKQTTSIENYLEQFRVIENDAQGNAELWKNVLSAWWHCHQQRMNFVFSRSTRANTLKLPSMLCRLLLSYCCISDKALSDCLRGMATLEELYLEGIMTISTLPPEKVLRSMQSLRIIKILSCWSLRSLGGLHALSKLEKFEVEGCWCLEMENGYTRLPSTLQSFVIQWCVFPRDILNGDFPCLQNVVISKCRISTSLTFGKLTSLKLLSLCNCPNLRSIRGLESCPFIDILYLQLHRNLAVEYAANSWKGCRDLHISSSVMLNRLLLSGNYASPKNLFIEYCQEEVITFEKSEHLRSIKLLVFETCKETKNLPTTLRDFSTLKSIIFIDCPEISGLPELPDSVQNILVRGCPVLRERCRPNGPDWHRIQRIRHRMIE